jgi:hypothetical protein
VMTEPVAVELMTSAIVAGVAFEELAAATLTPSAEAAADGSAVGEAPIGP